MDHTHDKANSMLDTVANLLTPSKGKQNNHESSGSDSDIQYGQFQRMVLKKKGLSPKIIQRKEVKNKRASKGELSQDEPCFCVPNCARYGVYDSQMAKNVIFVKCATIMIGNTCDRELENRTVWSCQKCRKIPLLMTVKMNVLLKCNEF